MLGFSENLCLVSAKSRPPIVVSNPVRFPLKLRRMPVDCEFYNLDQAKCLAKEEGLILVGKISLYLKMRHLGFRNVVALMGSSMTDKHVNLLIEALGPNGKLIMIFESGEAGINIAPKKMDRLMKNTFIRVIRL